MANWNESGLTAIDLFSGCGGLSEGLKHQGFVVLAAIEIASKAAATYRENHPEVDLREADIRTVNPAALLKDLGILPGELGLLAGCPPCQGFSRLRTRNKAVAVPDGRNALIGEFFRFVKELQPKTVMLENVPSLRFDPNFLGYVSDLEGDGYSVNVEVLDAANYSVPQRRKRLIMLASKLHEPFVAAKNSSKLTVRSAISRLQAPASSADPLHSLPERRSASVVRIIELIPKDGGSRKDLPEEFQLECHKRSSGFNDVYGRMRWDDVAPTITSGCHNPSKGRFLHPVDNRAITLREAAVLQGFPDNYRFNIAHGKESIALMIGNALPPPFISAHAEQLRDAIVRG